MIEDIYKNLLFRRYFPAFAALVFVVVFVSLGMWQLDRAAEKNLMLDRFGEEASFSRPTDYASLEQFDRIEYSGRYLADRQVLIDNIVQDGRLGYYVITPFRPSMNEPLLLVNRGWIQKAGPSGAPPELSVDAEFITIRGLVGRLPRVGIRPGEAFEGSKQWPRIAVYPTLEEVAAQLDEDLLPIVMLLHPDAEHGFVRRWQPNISGPMTHYSYAFQWFAMAAAVIVILAWHTRKRLRRDRGKT